MNITTDYLPYQRFGRKYLLPLFILLLFIMMLGQIAIQLTSIRQLNKTSGKITALSKEKIINEYNVKDTSEFSLIVTLNRGKVFTIQDEVYAAKLYSELKTGDDITIYYPTQLVNILSATFAESVSQVEYKGQVLYSFESQKQLDLYLIGFCIVGMLFFYGFYRFVKRRYH